MSDPATLVEARALRDAAWAMVGADLAQLSRDLEARGIGERIKDRASEGAHEAFDHAVEVASEHKGVVAATLLALVAWFLRGPIGGLFDTLFGGDDDEAEQPDGESVEAHEGDDS